MIAGNSEMAFGIDSKKIEDSIGIPVVNWGLHGGLGRDYIIDDAINNLREGDILFLRLERNFTETGNGEIVSLPYLTDIVPAKFWDLSLANKYIVIKGIHKLLYSKLYYNFLKFRGLGCVDEEYNVTNFNMYGDEVRHWIWKKGKGEVIDYDVRDASRIENFDHDAFKEYVSKINMLEEKGVSVYFIPPAINQSSYLKSIDMENYVRNEYKKNGIFLLFDYDLCSLEDTLFYKNSATHLNKMGVDKYTEALICSYKKRTFDIK